ncbi:magnesium transporter [Chitinimonas taiwanensis]|jgi:magnesium transporter|uniref:Magnesium transporter MgtE n=1 Tax=Chitinimonas taiwanensis DSM 18899 TaxID=1121279 RepID=A0A1K2H472_9NEIS|nr:magnesium transporter [Chitinimonas taiwanensis]SFZ70465.1 magnesium transporter [Chitinimonas taiwanensis DSM 18899]
MTQAAPKPKESLQESLQQVQRLLARHKLVEGLVHKQDMPKHDLVESLVHKQNLVELEQKLAQQHPADIAFILESLPPEDRLLVWGLIHTEVEGDVLLEVSDAVRESLLADMDREEILAAAEHLDTDELADLAPDLPQDVMHALIGGLEEEERAELQSALSYGDDQVGSLMDFDMVTIRDDVTLEVVLRYLRRFDELPHHCDKLFVVDNDQRLKGVLAIKKLLVSDPELEVAAAMAREVVSFNPDDDAGEAALAFERYDLISAPVVDSTNKVIGRLTVDMMVDVIREETDAEVLSLGGLKEEEDLFSSVWESAKNRWPWLAVNICTAFLASRVIGAFEHTIEALVALAALMPIVSGIGGNTGTQTVTLVVRGLALGQINASSARRLIAKEHAIALLNGVVWGGVLGFIAFLLYRDVHLGIVMAAAMILNLQVAAFVGLIVPLTMSKFGRDPAYGSSVFLTAATDSMGFFIFLGLATIFLL